jgi:hypothetical protein
MLRHLSENFPHEPVALHAEKINGKRIWLRAGALMLLLAVAALSTLAKNSQYSSRQSENRFVNIASKMNAAKSPVVFERAPLQPVCRLAPPPPEYAEPVRVEPPAPAIQPIGLLVSPLRRPPPVVLA